MEKSGNQGGELADLCTFRSGKLTNYRAILETVEMAKTILAASGDSLFFSRQFLREDDLETYLTLVQNDWKAPEGTLKTLCEVCGEKAAVVFLTHASHGYAPGALTALLKAKPRWLRNYPTLSSYLKTQYGTSQKETVRMDGMVAAPKVTVSETTVPAKMKEKTPDTEKKRSSTPLFVLGGLALVSLLGILLVFFGAFDFMAAEETIVLTVDAQIYIIRMIGAVVFSILLTLFLGFLILLAAVRVRKNK